MKKLILSAAAAAILTVSLAGVSSAAGPTIVNGSFETGTDPGVFTQLSAVNSSITGWTVSSGTVDYIGTYWQAADGVRSLDLSGSVAGAVQQVFATTVGTSYRVTFSMSGNPAGVAGTKTMTASTGGTPIAFSYEVGAGNTLVDMKWANKSLLFTATAATTTLTFTSTTSGVYGPALDKVRVQLAAVKAFSDCKNGGWRQLRDGQGHMFKNQGDCVSYFASKGRNGGAGTP